MNDHEILYGDVFACLFNLKDNFIDCAVTSPPYWSQRDYGFKGQIGNESKADDYLAKLVTVFSVLRRKLKPKGVFYLNIGDKFLTKYGNTPLGMIPYKLAYYLVDDGWQLEDIIIWYKPNHMPSSVKNRFTTTYEPIFVLTKEEDNYYREYKQKEDFSNIFKIPIQPVPCKHMATYPEKLIETLLKLELPNNALVSDPFAGSGTTCKAVQNLCSEHFNHRKMNSIMIEAYKDYVDIIKERCKIKAKNIHMIPFKAYDPKPLANNFKIPHNDGKTVEDFNIEPNDIIIKIFKTTEEFRSFLPLLYDGSLADALNDDGVFFLGLMDHDINNIFDIAQVNENGWIIRNMIVVPQGNDWIPVFMLVKDIKSVRYRFNLDAIRVNHRYETSEDWNEIDFVGYKVDKSQAFFKKPDGGLIAKVILKYPNGLPHWVVVKWKTGDYSVEEVINGAGRKNPIQMFCPKCKTELKKSHHYEKVVSCPSCSLKLWRDAKSIPILMEKNPRVEPEYHYEEIDVVEKITKKDYDGKFKDTEPINRGQSPGARVSVQESYFSVQRYYDAKQSLICDYLNLHRKKVGLTKNELTRKFPPSYKHTVGHWLRKDMGGSLPKYEDLMTLNDFLQLAESYINYISRMGLKLQTVLADAKGKNPGDFLDLPLPMVIKLLEKVGDQ